MYYELLEKIFVIYDHGAHSDEQNYEWNQRLFRSLAKTHGVFAKYSCAGKASDAKYVFSQPLVERLSLDDWRAYYRYENRDDSSDAGLGVQLAYVSQTDKPSGLPMIRINYNAESPYCNNDIMISGMEEYLTKTDIVVSIMAACIDGVPAHRAEFAEQSMNNDLPFLYHKLWLKHGIPYPEGDALGRMRPHHPPPSVSEAWHGGTLYTWPEHEPTKLLAARESMTE